MQRSCVTKALRALRASLAAVFAPAASERRRSARAARRSTLCAGGCWRVCSAALTGHWCPQSCAHRGAQVLAGVLARTSPAAGVKAEAGAAPALGVAVSRPHAADAAAPAAAQPKPSARSCLRPSAAPSAAPAPRAAAPALALAGSSAGASCAGAVRAAKPLRGGAAGHAARRLMAVEEAPESPPDIVAQLRALSPFAALSHVPIADA